MQESLRESVILVKAVPASSFPSSLQRTALCLLWLFAAIAPAADHWAFQPLKPVHGANVDEFIHHELATHNRSPSSKANPRALIRRASFDLTGLPPSPEDVEAFVADPSPQAFERLINRLLASPHHGEHWARHWLDVARYSDTKGYVYGREEKRWVHSTQYRDWVVRAFNSDMPYDRFLMLQIAADQLVPPRSPDLAAMGFLTLGRRFLGVTHDIIDDRIDVLMRGTQALTVSCARCHDHKFDPIPTRDYYALYGIFQSSAEALVPCAPGEAAPELAALQAKNRDLMSKRREEQMERTRARLADYLQAQQELEKYPEEVFGQILEERDLNPFIVRRFQAWLSKHPDPVWSSELLHSRDSPCHVPDEHIANIEMYFPTNVVVELWKAQGDVDRYLIQNNTVTAHATILADRTTPSSPRVFLRGNPLTKGEEVPRQFLSLFGDQRPFVNGSGRLELAKAIANPANPLTARVMVNRLWQHHFGRGLVDTPSDFGKQGGTPSHPELLDWLAQRFIESGWSLKSMHRIMMLSETYQQQSLNDDSGDPGNRLFGRMSPHRLSFEEARDAWLTAAGRLDSRIGGPASPLFASNNTRRTLYALIDRQSLPSVLRTFDFANPDLSIAQRTETSVPQQALFAWNHPFVVDQAKALLRRSDVAPLPPAARIERIYALLYQRPPRTDELQASLDFVQEERPITLSGTTDASSAWHYGYGEWDDASGRIKDFQPFPHFTGSAWQGDHEWPNARLGWAQLTAHGGHPGNSRKHAVVRRWIAAFSGSYDIRSTLVHEPKVGDGIRAFISHSRTGNLRSTSLLGASADLSLDAISFSAGDALDFVVDIGDGLNSDQFLWAPAISHSTAITGAGGDALPGIWDAAKDFSHQPRAVLDPWEQLVQVLMLANEFFFID